MSAFVVGLYLVLYLAALALAFRNRKTFPLSESIMVMLILGLGFTSLVYVVAPRIADFTPAPVPASELAFVLAYVGLVSVLLVVVNPVPPALRADFLKSKLISLAYKLTLFVIIPLTSLRLFWNVSWEALGFTVQDLPGQWVAALILSLCFGGFNLVAGSGAKPLRAGAFTPAQVLLGFPAVFFWNVLEVGLVEEFFFRAFLQGTLMQALGSSLAGICAASLLFGLAHAPGLYLRRADKDGPLGERPTLLNAILYAVLVLSPAGWFTGLLYLRTGSLLVPVLVHAAIDTVAHVSAAITAFLPASRAGAQSA